MGEMRRVGCGLWRGEWTEEEVCGLVGGYGLAGSGSMGYAPT